MKYELRPTADGSYTLYSKEYDECYHSVRDGALTEALQKHVRPAFSLVKKPHLNILDICFGLGINTLATLHYFEHQSDVRSIAIYSPELDSDLLSQLATLEYPEALKPYLGVLEKLIKHKVYKSDNIHIELFVGDAREYVRGLAGIDIVYQDAFSPKKNPTLWTVEYFADLFACTSDDAVLTTYSIATPVRLALDEAGWKVYEIKPQGIKKITIASKQTLPLEQIDMEAKRARSASQPLRDKE